MHTPTFNAPASQWELVEGPDLLELINERQGALNEEEAVSGDQSVEREGAVSRV